jgi:hypothetical protein
MGATSTGQANIKTIAQMDAAMKVATAAAPAYTLGGHLNAAAGNTGNMDCQTCHAVHGQASPVAPGLPALLAINNQVYGTNPSALCEGCHFGGNAGAQVGTFITAPVADSDHPIDSRIGRAFYPTGVAIPDGTHVVADWGVSGPNNDSGASPFFTNGVTGTPVCSSCHDTHGGIPGSALLRGPSVTLAGAETWTFDYDEWCFVCHLASEIIPNNHHSVINNLNTVSGDEMDSQLGCGDCHGTDAGLGWSAHNGFWAFEVAISNTDSAFCLACHNVNNPRLFAGALRPAKTYNGGAGNYFPATHGVLRDGGTGGVAAGHEMNGRNGTNTNMDLTPDWSWASAGTSQWATAAPGNLPICESCHNILTNGIAGAANQGLKNGWQANLLLGPYEDDGAGNKGGAGEGGTHDFYGDTTVGAGPTADRFCRSCHNTGGTGFTGLGAGDFVHNPEAHTRFTGYTYAAGTNPYGRSINTLMTTPNDSTASATCPDVSTADATGAPNQASYPADNEIGCDSCHRPHNADADSLDGDRYLILEVTAPNAWGTTICAECHNTDVQCNN